MNTVPDTVVQILSWVIAFIEITLSLYTLFSNPRKPVNQNLALLLILFGLNSAGIAQMLGAQHEWQTHLPTLLLVISSTAVQPLLMVATIWIVRPGWFSARTAGQAAASGIGRVIAAILYLVALIPTALAAYDLTLPATIRQSASLFYTGLVPGEYAGGFVDLQHYTQGLLATPIRVIYFILFNLILMVLLVYFGRFDRSLARRERRLAGIQLLVLVVVFGLQAYFSYGNVFWNEGWFSALPALVSSTLFAGVYAVTAYQQILAEANIQRGSLVYRIATLVLVVSIPLMAAQVLFITDRSGTLVEQAAADVLQQQNQALKTQVELWLDLNTRALADLALQRDIRGMVANRQIPILQAMSSSYPYMNVVAVTDKTGKDMARSDSLPIGDQSARLWFRRVMEGAPLANQVLLGNNARPVLVVAKPVYEALNVITGVVMFEARLDELSNQFRIVRVGETGTAFLVDEKNQLIAHPDPTVTSWLRDYSDYPPIKALRLAPVPSDPNASGQYVEFVDNQGNAQRAFVSLLSNGWGVVAVQSEAELLAPLRTVQNLSLVILVLGLGTLGGMIAFTVRQGLRPVQLLTAAVAAISAGDLDRQVPVEAGADYSTNDEIGFLAQTFNGMTAELRELIGNLEQRVEERTEELTRRSVQLEAAAQVARNAAGIRNLRVLLTQTTKLIASTFGYYHSGIFIIDEAREFAVLQAVNSEGGQRMLARGHKLKVGQVGIVGYVAAYGRPRIALDVGEDAIFFNNPDLPNTRSEMALPLIINERVMGVLDVQSTQPIAFKQEDIDVLQILADQLALAMENTRLLDESRRALEELRGVYGERTRQDWQERLSRGGVAYQYTRLGVSAVDPASIAPSKQPPGDPDLQSHTLKIPITLRDQKLGQLTLRRDPDQPAWSPEEASVAGEAISQVASALENARLLEEARARSNQLRLLQEVTAVAASHTNLLELLDNVSQKLRAGLRLLHCSVILIDPSGDTGTLAVHTSSIPFHPGTKMVGIRLHLQASPEFPASPFFRALQARTTVAVYDAQLTMPASDLQNFARQRETGTMLVTPLISRGQVIGFILMDFPASNYEYNDQAELASPARSFSEEDLQLFDQLSLQISSALDVARTFEQTMQRAEREQRLGEITSRIRETLDVESILRTTAQEVRKLLDVPEVTIQLINPEQSLPQEDDPMVPPSSLPTGQSGQGNGRASSPSDPQ